jgi:hypothetical protein
VIATYDYCDEGGTLLYQKCRWAPNARQRFTLRRPDGNGGWINKLGKVRRVVYRLPEVVETIGLDRPIFIVEGEKDVDNCWKIGIPATCNYDGGGKWHDQQTPPFAGADVCVITDNDDVGREHGKIVAAKLSGVAKKVRVFAMAALWPQCPPKGDISDWIEQTCCSAEQLYALIARAEPKPSSLEQVISVFDKWLVLRNHTPVYAVLGTVAANLLPGDPVWLGVISPPSSAKTEILNALSGLSYVEAAATLTPAALLSGTPKRQRNKGARGGLLMKIGEFGILCLKDFGSILSLRPDAKAEIIAALRELFDGSWTRHLGTDGGITLSWSGKVGLVFGATEAFDDHYSVIGSLGDRFLLCRLTSSYGGQLRKALDHTGRANKVMREELANAVAGLFANNLQEPAPLTEDEFQRLDNVVSLAVRLRAHVNRHPYSREIESIHGAEGPGRLGLSLERLFAGLVAIGLSRGKALFIVEDITLASTPPIRRHAFELLTDKPTETREIAKALKLPTTTARRALEELAAHGLAVRSREKDEDGEEKKSGADLWSLDDEWTAWRAKWRATARATAAT